MQIHNLKRLHKNKKDRLVGRGGKHAKTSGRGGKGQTARAGNKRRPELRDIIKKLPKNRGYSFKSKKKPFFLRADKVASKDETFSAMRKRLGIKGRKIMIK
jgi:ribosomal protein L15